MALRLKVVKSEDMTDYEDYVLVHRKGERQSEPAMLEVFVRMKGAAFDTMAEDCGYWESVPVVRPK